MAIILGHIIWWPGVEEHIIGQAEAIIIVQKKWKRDRYDSCENNYCKLNE